MNQTKLESALEAACNTASGFIISWVLLACAIGPLMMAGTLSPLSAGGSFWITAIYTIVSVIRSYVWRRFFNAGVHRAIHSAIKRLYIGR